MMSISVPNISDSEYEIMKVIWEKHPIKSNDIVEIIGPLKGWSEKTVKTLINRLLNKKVIDFEKDGRSYSYFPLVKEDDYKKMKNKSFLQRVYNGSVSAMICGFIKYNKLSKEDIAELKQLLEGEE